MTSKSVSLGLFSFVANFLSGVLQRWPLIAVIAFAISPVGPHLRWEYAYRDTYGHRTYVGCKYLGSRGFFHTVELDQCPFIAWLDFREFRR